MSKSPLTQRQLNYLMRTHLIFSGSFTIWFLVSTPQPLFNIFIVNYLTNSQLALGILVSAISFVAIFHMVAVFISNMVTNQKWFWIITTLIQRSISFVLSLVALLANREELRPDLYLLLLSAMILSAAIGTIGAPFWWAWMGQIIPKKIQGTFFGRRAYASGVVNAIVFILITIILDYSPQEHAFTIFSIIFFIGALMGVINVLAHLRIPDPPSSRPATPSSRMEDFASPLKNHNYRRFLLAIGMLLFAINLTGPFIAPYLVSKEGGQIPKLWIGIQFVIRQLLWIASTRLWGKLMDRMGGKPVVIVGVLFFTYWLGFPLLSPTNYPLILVLQGVIAGFFGPALFEGMAPWMMSIAPADKQLSYSAWFWSVHGLATAIGSLSGGFFLRYITQANLPLLSNNGFISMLFISLFFIGVTVIIFLSVHYSQGKPVKFLMQRISNPGIFRSLINLGIIERSSSSSSVSDTLTKIQGESADIALEEITDRLYDPDPEVREEAVRALGRIRSEEALEALSTEVNNPESLLRVQAVRAIGKIGSLAARELLEKYSQEAPLELQIAALSALGSVGDRRSLPIIQKVLQSARNPRILVAAALSASYLGEIAAIAQVVPLLIKTTSPTQINEISLCIGNALGVPHTFYQYVSGSSENKEKRSNALIVAVQQNLLLLMKHIEPEAKPRSQLDEHVRIFIKTLHLLIERDRFPELLRCVNTMVLTLHTLVTDHISISPQTTHRFMLCQQLLQLSKSAEENKQLQSTLILLLLYFFSALRLP